MVVVLAFQHRDSKQNSGVHTFSDSHRITMEVLRKAQKVYKKYGFEEVLMHADEAIWNVENRGTTWEDAFQWCLVRMVAIFRFTQTNSNSLLDIPLSTKLVSG